MAVDNPAGDGSDLINEAIELAATRYGRNQVDQGKGDNADGLARWWLQQNAQGARHRATALLADYDLTATQLADALATAGNPAWLRAHKRPDPNTEPPPQSPPDETAKAAVSELVAGIRQTITQPQAPANQDTQPGQPTTPGHTDTHPQEPPK